jgi:predicted nucleotidyltransferase
MRSWYTVQAYCSVVKEHHMALTNLTSLFTDVLTEAAAHGVVSAYLFGSHAKGQAHAENDIEVGLTAQSLVSHSS